MTQETCHIVLCKSCLFDCYFDIRPKTSRILTDLTKSHDRHNGKLLAIKCILKIWEWPKEFLIDFCKVILFNDAET